MANLTDKFIKDGFPNLVTIGATTDDNPTSGTLENGKGNNLTSVTFDGAVVVNESGGDNDFRVEGDNEVNLLFVDASTDRVGIGTNSPTTILDIEDTTNVVIDLNTTTADNNTTIRFQEGGSVKGTVGYEGTNNGLILTTGGFTPGNGIFIDDSQNVGIGTSSPSAPLHFGKSVYAEPTSEDFYRIKFRDPGGTNNDVGIGLTNSTSLGFNTGADGDIAFYAGTRGELARFVSSGGNLYFRMASGTDGIQFNGDTAAANALDDYEEGTWTPVYEPVTGSFTTMTMDVVSATYTKVGRQVTVRAYFRTDDVNITGGSGGIKINGLPFTCAVSGQSAISLGFISNWSTAPDGGYINSETTSIFLYKSNKSTNSSVSDLTTGATANQNTLILTATYFV